MDEGCSDGRLGLRTPIVEVFFCGCRCEASLPDRFDLCLCISFLRQYWYGEPVEGGG